MNSVKMAAASFCNISLTLYQSTQCHIAEDLYLNFGLWLPKMDFKEIRYEAVFWIQLAYIKVKCEHGKCPIKCLDFLYRLRVY